MKIENQNGLLFTSVTIRFQGREKQIHNIVIDTGASHTLISQDEVDDIGIRVTIEDDIITSYGIGGKEHAFVKKVESIEVGEYVLRDVSIDFTSFPYHNINGLLGLDVLLSGKFNIDLNQLELRSLQ